MTRSKDAYQVSAQDLQDAINQLNFALARISDRLDKIEGLRDEFETLADMSVTGKVIGKSEVQDTDGTVIHSLE